MGPAAGCLDSGAHPRDRHPQSPSWDGLPAQCFKEMEAELTGGLQHPGVVPGYGLGHDDDGRPSDAMRPIKGDSL